MKTLNPFTHCFDSDVVFCVKCQKVTTVKWVKFIDDDNPEKYDGVWKCTSCNGYAFPLSKEL